MNFEEARQKPLDPLDLLREGEHTVGLMPRFFRGRHRRRRAFVSLFLGFDFRLGFLTQVLPMLVELLHLECDEAFLGYLDEIAFSSAGCRIQTQMKLTDTRVDNTEAAKVKFTPNALSPRNGGWAPRRRHAQNQQERVRILRER